MVHISTSENIYNKIYEQNHKKMLKINNFVGQAGFMLAPNLTLFKKCYTIYYIEEMISYEEKIYFDYPTRIYATNHEL